MPVPASPVIRAARRWLENLPTSNEAQCRALFTGHRSFADVTPTQYAAAYDWLQSQGLLRGVSASTATSAIFEAVVAEALWFKDSDVLVPDANSLPEDGVAAADALGIKVAEAFALLKHCWGKVDVAARSRVGSAGEAGLMALFSEVPEIRATHVAAESDGYGYDITAQVGDLVQHIEVKSTTRRGRLSIYLSRNEFETMKRDREWVLAAVRLDAEMNVVCVGTVSQNWIATAAPIDSPGGRWESVKLDVPQGALRHGLFPLAERTVHGEAEILRGRPNWPG